MRHLHANLRHAASRGMPVVGRRHGSAGIAGGAHRGAGVDRGIAKPSSVAVP